MATFFYVGFAGQLARGSHDELTDSNNIMETQYVDYPTLRSLTNSSDAVIVGKIVAVKETLDQPIPMTDFSVTVESALKGKLNAGDTITVQQLGGGRVIAEADRLMKAGEQYVLFMGYNPDTQKYIALGGPQGKFLIQNSMAYSMDNFDPQASFVNTKVKDRPLNDFVSEVSSVASGGTSQ